MAYQLIINEFTGGLTGHVNVSFVANGVSQGTFGRNLLVNEVGGADQPGYLGVGGVYDESGLLSNAHSSVTITLTQSQYQAALNYAQQQAKIGNGVGYYITGGNCVDFAQAVLDATGLSASQANIDQYLSNPALVKVYAGILDYLRSGMDWSAIGELSYSPSTGDITGTSTELTQTVFNNITYTNLIINSNPGQASENATFDQYGDLVAGQVELSNFALTVGSKSDVTINGNNDDITLLQNATAQSNGDDNDITLGANSEVDANGNTLTSAEVDALTDDGADPDDDDSDQIDVAYEPSSPPYGSNVSKLPPGNGSNGGLGLSKIPSISKNSVSSLQISFDSAAAESAAQTALLQADSILSSNGAPASSSTQFEGAKWSDDVITWNLSGASNGVGAQFSGSIGSQYTSLIQNAFQTWAAATGLKFVEVSDSASADITLGWSNFNSATTGIMGYTGFNTQNGSFTPGVTISLENPAETPLVTDAYGQLAYADTQTEFTQLLLHEIGHALGLADDGDPNSIMYPILSDTNETLDATDIAGIQSLYTPSPSLGSSGGAEATGIGSLLDLRDGLSPSTLVSNLIGPTTLNSGSPFSAEAEQLIDSMSSFGISGSATAFTPAFLAPSFNALNLAQPLH